MNFKLKTFADILGMSTEQVNAELAGPRAATAKARAQLLLAELDEKIVNKQRQIHESCTSKDIDFNTVADKLDDLDLLELRRDRITGIIEQLFPAAQ